MKMLYILFLCFAANLAATTPSGNTITLEANGADYTLKVEGAITDCPVLLVREFLSGKITTTPAYVREDGVLAKLQEDYPTMALNFGETPPGEPIILNILPCDRTRSCAKIPAYATYKFIPKPLIVENADGITLSCEIADVTARSFWIRMNGLLPQEEVTFRSTLFGKGKILPECADDKGCIEFFFAMEGDVSSSETYEIKASNSRFQLAL